MRMLSAALLTLAAPACAAFASRAPVPAERLLLADPFPVAAPLAPSSTMLARAARIATPASVPLTAAPESPSAISTLAAARPPDARETAEAPAEKLKNSALDFFARPGEAAPVDATASLKASRQAVREDRAGPMPRNAAKYRYLLVPGISWDALHDYFGPNVRRLRERGLDALLVETDPLGTTAENADAVRRAISTSDKPVVLIGHSKGGLDALRALTLHPELQSKVAKLIAIQSPYRGSAIADLLLSRRSLYAATLAYTRLINPRRLLSLLPFFRRGSVSELTPAARREANAGASPLRRGLKVYSVVSRIDDKTAVNFLLLAASTALKALSGRPNDGLVAPEDAVFPGSRYALLEHVGHFDTVAELTDWKYKPLGARGHDPHLAADLTEAIVRWALATAKRPTPH